MPAHEFRVMVSSTSFDLPVHRKSVIEAIVRAGCTPEAMEYGSATPDGNAIVSSRKMVERADLYLGIFAYRYGAIVDDTTLNPQRWSVTEHEYRHAVAIGKPILVYFMHEDHPIKIADVDAGELKAKLDALKAELAVKHTAAFFLSPDKLEFLVLDSLQKLDRRAGTARPHLILSPPALYAVPPYTLTDEFVGRQNELDALDRWAASEQTLMVYEAIGGMGKSALTWEWTQRHAEQQIPGLAGRVWWSFYDAGSSMRGLLRHALAYVRRQNPEELRTVDDWETAQALLDELRKKPYLLVLDGFERILAAYHLVDKAQIPDDKIEDLRQFIQPTDGDLIRYLVDCGPSKILISTRLMPRALESIRGVAHLKLEGLDPKDAEALARGKGIKGTSRRILEFTAQFEHHPLVLRVVCGMVNDPPHRGDFDKWLDDPQGGGQLELARLNLKQRHTHILEFALAGLTPLQRKLLSRISVLSDNVEYETVRVLNPYASDAEFYAALKNLEDRGLLQWEPTTNTYDLHPVVRASAYQLLEAEDREPTYNKLRDYFAALPPENFERAMEVGDLKNSLEVFRLLLGAGRLGDAIEHYRGDLSDALVARVGAYGSVVALARDLLARAGTDAVKTLGASGWSYVTNDLAIALDYLGDRRAARLLHAEAIRVDLALGDWIAVAAGISNFPADGPALEKRASELCLEIGTIVAAGLVARATLGLASVETKVGNYEGARRLLAQFAAYPLPDKAMYQAGTAERMEAELLFREGRLNDAVLDSAESAARRGNSIFNLLWLGVLRAQLELRREDPAAALAAADRTIGIVRRTGSAERLPHALRAAALARLGRVVEAREILLEDRTRPHGALYTLYVAEAYTSLGDADAHNYVHDAYVAAWADGAPFCYHWQLGRCRELMKQLGQPEPNLRPFDPASAEKLPHEDEIRAAIRHVKAERAKREEPRSR